MKQEKIQKKYYIDWYSVAPGVWGIKDVFVNMYLVHNPTDNTWVLVDAGLKTSASKIKKVAEKLFWPEVTPKAIILTHAHFDHVGSLKKLANEWNVPIYAHKLEEPYLIGKSSYPPPDPGVGGGLMSFMSFSYPKGPIDVQDRLELLPDDETVPYLPEWTYIHTPGHAPGHVSLYRKRDGVLLAGDAVVTTKQESAISVMTEKTELCGPPKYFTYNWNSARQSVQKLADLDVEVLASGHGRPMRGDDLRRSLHNLADNFTRQAVPHHGRYVDDPALVNRDGVQYLPAGSQYSLVLKAAAVTLIAVVGIVLFAKYKPARKRKRFGFSFKR